MKVIFALSNPGAFIFYDDVVRHLAGQGHQVLIWHGPINKASLTDRALQAAQAETGTCQSGELRRSAWHWPASDIRGLVDCGIYFRKEHLSPWLEKRWEKNLSYPLRRAINIAPIRKWLFRPAVQQTLHRWERRIPVDRAILRQLEGAHADIVVASPYIYGHSREVDYVKAAQRLGIPTAAVVQSWDNLTTKGTYHVMPDILIVWNEPLAEEAFRIHGVPRERIIVTGAPRFDAWLATKPSTSRQQFLSNVGLPANDNYVTYLCSSNSIAGDETAFVCELADGLRQYPPTQHLKLLVRPYPSNTGIWDNVSRENMVVWPRQGGIPDTLETRSQFYDTLHHGIAAFGVNTTAFLEAAMADKPCVTAFTEHYQRTQVESAHFQHLLRADFIEIADGFGEAVKLLAQVCAGADHKADNRRRFVREFIRPQGLDVPAGLVMANVITGLAGKQSASQLRLQMKHNETGDNDDLGAAASL